MVVTEQTRIDDFLKEVDIDAVRQRYDGIALTTTVLYSTPEGRSLGRTMYRHHVTIHDLRSLIGQQSTTNPYGFWNDMQKLEDAVLDIADTWHTEYKDKDGNIRRVAPTLEVIEAVDPKLRSAISNKGISVNGIWRRHGYDPNYNDDHPLADWQDFEPLMRDIVSTRYVHEGKVVKKAGEVPTYAQMEMLTDIGELQDIHYLGLVLDGRKIARIIGDSHGGINSVSQKLGKKPRKRKNNFWKKETAISELRSYLSAEGGVDADGVYTLRASELMTDEAIKAAGRHDLRNVITDLGGYHAVRRMLGISDGSAPPAGNLHPDDIKMLVYSALGRQPRSVPILAFCLGLDRGYQTMSQIQNAYFELTGRKPKTRHIRNILKNLVKHHLVEEVRDGNRLLFLPTQFGEIIGQPVAYDIMDSEVPLPLPGFEKGLRSPEEALEVLSAIEYFSGVTPQHRPAERNIDTGIRRLRRTGHFDFGELSGEAVHTADTTLRNFGEATASLTELSEFRKKFDRDGKRNARTYATRVEENLPYAA